MLLKTMTFDNGMEFSWHHRLRDQFNIQTYFCDVYASWQKGGIENINGRLRRELPRKTDVKAMAQDELEQIIIGLNMTPRKMLAYKSPLEALAKEMGILFHKNVSFFLFNGMLPPETVYFVIEYASNQIRQDSGQIKNKGYLYKI